MVEFADELRVRRRTGLGRPGVADGDVELLLLVPAPAPEAPGLPVLVSLAFFRPREGLRTLD